MEFTWDETKRKGNLAKHGLDFADARGVFSGHLPGQPVRLWRRALRHHGLLDAEVVVIVHTETAAEIRVISMRKGTANEQEIFFENI